MASYWLNRYWIQTKFIKTTLAELKLVVVLIGSVLFDSYFLYKRNIPYSSANSSNRLAASLKRYVKDENNSRKFSSNHQWFGEGTDSWFHARSRVSTNETILRKPTEHILEDNGKDFGFSENATYSEKVALLTMNKIALWDVIRSCERSGSLDANIKQESITANNFVALFQKNLEIIKICFNGAKAETEYLKRVLPKLSDQDKDIELIRLPSTSPAMASMSFEEKVMLWSRAIKDLQTARASYPGH